MSLLRLEDVRFSYRGGERPALDGVTLAVAEGEWVGLLGAAGAGKSTLTLLPNGLIPQFVSGTLEGRVEVDGRDRRGLKVPETASEVGLVMEDFDSQVFQGRVDLEVAFGPENLGLPREEIGERIRGCLRAVGLGGLEERDPHTLSGGQRQRLVLASVLAGRPRLLVLDEPWSDLDPAGQRELTATLRASGCGGLLAGSELDLVHGVDRVAVLAAGRVLADGPPDALLRDDALLEEAGLPLPPLADLFRRMGRPERPLSVDEAVAHWTAPVEDRLRDPEPSGEPVLELEGVTFRYPSGLEALREVTLRVRRGEIVALLGHNGSGKSTAARHFVGLLRPQSGIVRVNGQDAARRTPAQLGAEVGYIFQNPDHQIFAETAREEVAFGPRNLGHPPAVVAERVLEALATVGLEGHEEEDPFSMTRGDRQRLAVASALAARPSILVFDEPTTGLDPARIRAMMDLVERLAAEGHTVVFITHSMEVAARYARRIVLLAGGRVRADGPARQIMHDPEALRDAGLVAPPIVEFSARLGLRACHAEEVMTCL